MGVHTRAIDTGRYRSSLFNNGRLLTVGLNHQRVILLCSGTSHRRSPLSQLCPAVLCHSFGGSYYFQVVQRFYRSSERQTLLFHIFSEFLRFVHLKFHSLYTIGSCCSSFIAYLIAQYKFARSFGLRFIFHHSIVHARGMNASVLRILYIPRSQSPRSSCININ